MATRAPILRWFLFGTIPSREDYRFLFDITRLNSLFIAQLAPVKTATIQVYSVFAQHWTKLFDLTLEEVKNSCDANCVREMNFHHISNQLRDPSTFIQDLSTVDVVAGDKFFIFITNHGLSGEISISHQHGLAGWDLVGPIQRILDEGAEILLFASACQSRVFVRPLITQFLKGDPKANISLMYDDPNDITCESSNVVLKSAPTTLIGTEFCHLLLSVLSNAKAVDNLDIHALLTSTSKLADSKFGCVLGRNSGTPISAFFGDIASFISPLVRSKAIMFTRISPFNGKLHTHPGILSSLLHVAEHALGRKITEKEYNDLDIEKVYDVYYKELRAITSVLRKYQLVIAGAFPGGKIPFLLAKEKVTLGKLMESIIVLKIDES